MLIHSRVYRKWEQHHLFHLPEQTPTTSAPISSVLNGFKSAFSGSDNILKPISIYWPYHTRKPFCSILTIFLFGKYTFHSKLSAKFVRNDNASHSRSADLCDTKIFYLFHHFFKTSAALSGNLNNLAHCTYFRFECLLPDERRK